MKRSLMSLALASVLAAAGAPSVFANSISDVEEARARERSGGWLTDREIDALRSYGSNDDGYHAHSYVDRTYGGITIGPSARGYAQRWLDRYVD